MNKYAFIIKYQTIRYAENENILNEESSVAAHFSKKP